MGGVARAGMRRPSFAVWVFVIFAVVVLQSLVHLAVVLGRGRIETIVDLDRSNGLPDLASTAALAVAVAAAARIAWNERRRVEPLPWLLSAGLGFLVLADILHDGPHPRSTTGWVVIFASLAVGTLLVLAALRFEPRPRATLVCAAGLLLASFCVNALDQLDARRLERARGDPVIEYQIVAKEGLELLGWSLVALALWDEVLIRGSGRATTIERASRAPAAPRRRAV